MSPCRRSFLDSARDIIVRDRKLRAGWRFALLVALFWACGPVLNPILERLHFPDRDMTPWSMVFNEGLDFALIVAISWFVSRLGRERLSQYGLPLRPGASGLFVRGVIWGIIPSIVILLPIWLAGACSFHGLALHGADLVRNAAIWAVAFLFVGLAEEFTFRGCALKTLGDAIGFWPAAVALSGLFGLVHFLFKQNEGWVDPLSVALYGLFWCFTLRRTGSLWFAVGFHAASDYTDMVVFAEPNTGAGGHPVPGHLLNVSFHGSDWITGGPRGTEASLLVFPILACLFYLFHRRFPARTFVTESEPA